MSEPLRILIVDDDESILDLLREALSDEGYEVHIATDGALALDLATRLAPDLILLDMRMPIVDGWAFAEAYRQQCGPHARIIVMTAARDARAIAAGIGADGYLAKPFSLDRLFTLVEEYDPRPKRQQT